MRQRLMHLDRGGKVRLERTPADQRGSSLQVFMLYVDARILLVKRVDVQVDFDHFVCLVAGKPKGLLCFSIHKSC
jgi:hypothetical protein